MNRTVGLACIALASFANVAFAQVFNEPNFYVWGTRRPPGFSPGQ